MRNPHGGSMLEPLCDMGIRVVCCGLYGTDQLEAPKGGRVVLPGLARRQAQDSAHKGCHVLNAGIVWCDGLEPGLRAYALVQLPDPCVARLGVQRTKKPSDGCHGCLETRPSPDDVFGASAPIEAVLVLLILELLLGHDIGATIKVSLYWPRPDQLHPAHRRRCSLRAQRRPWYSPRCCCGAASLLPVGRGTRPCVLLADCRAESLRLRWGAACWSRR